MESPTVVQGVSFRQKPRAGQLLVFNYPNLHTLSSLNVKLPTGYGKTFTALGLYSILQRMMQVTRLLYIVPSTAQLEQFVSDASDEMRKVGIEGPTAVRDIAFLPWMGPTGTYARHRKNQCQTFATTVQALSFDKVGNRVDQLLEIGQWMIVIDEYHHYGIEKPWGKLISALPRRFLLAMSATPNRPNEDSAFGVPNVSISYEDAYREGAVKNLLGHAYDYKIDAIFEDGTIKTFTTRELVNDVGSEEPDKIERFRIERNMRWSPKYVSPLVNIPIDRMLAERVRSGYMLQFIITAMCVSHAELVCSQVRTMYPELRIDWVGTGQYGRPDEDNAAILKKFCPPKNEDGVREPELDGIIHVGVAGEGVDAVNVSEIQFLCPVNNNNRNKQTIGRGSRRLGEVECNVSFDRSTKFAEIGYVGSKIRAAMDDEPPPDDDDTEPPEPPTPGTDPWPPELPPEPTIQIHDMELLGIESGDAGAQRMARVLQTAGYSGIDYAAVLNNLDHEDWQEKIIPMYRKFREIEAREHNVRAVIAQWRAAVDVAVSNAAGITIRIIAQSGARIERSLSGDIKRRINTQKKRALGEISNDIEICRQHYTWTINLAKDLRETKRVPLWLS